MQETQRENEQERGEAVKKKRKKKRRDTDWSTFILPTDMPQKQFHNLICMGLF